MKRFDESAWERFVDIYGGLIFSWCGRYGASPEDCSDLLQEVLLKVMKERFCMDSRQLFGNIQYLIFLLHLLALWRIPLDTRVFQRLLELHVI